MLGTWTRRPTTRHSDPRSISNTGITETCTLSIKKGTSTFLRQTAEGQALQLREHVRLRLAAHVRLRARPQDGHADIAAVPADHTRLVRQVVAPARLDVDRRRVSEKARENPLEVARGRAVAVRGAGRGERRRGVVHVERDAGRKDGARGGGEERAREVGGKLGVEERGERVGGVG